MKRLLKGLKWRDAKDNDKKLEQELKRKTKALLDYAMKNGIGYLDLTFFPGYISCRAKLNSDQEEHLVDSYAFMEGYEDA